MEGIERESTHRRERNGEFFYKWLGGARYRVADKKEKENLHDIKCVCVCLYNI